MTLYSIDLLCHWYHHYLRPLAEIKCFFSQIRQLILNKLRLHVILFVLIWKTKILLGFSSSSGYRVAFIMGLGQRIDTFTLRKSQRMENRSQGFFLLQDNKSKSLIFQKRVCWTALTEHKLIEWYLTLTVKSARSGIN